MPFLDDCDQPSVHRATLCLTNTPSFLSSSVFLGWPCLKEKLRLSIIYIYIYLTLVVYTKLSSDHNWDLAENLCKFSSHLNLRVPEIPEACASWAYSGHVCMFDPANRVPGILFGICKNKHKYHSLNFMCWLDSREHSMIGTFSSIYRSEILKS